MRIPAGVRRLELGDDLSGYADCLSRFASRLDQAAGRVVGQSGRNPGWPGLEEALPRSGPVLACNFYAPARYLRWFLLASRIAFEGSSGVTLGSGWRWPGSSLAAARRGGQRTPSNRGIVPADVRRARARWKSGRVLPPRSPSGQRPRRDSRPVRSTTPTLREMEVDANRNGLFRPEATNRGGASATEVHMSWPSGDPSSGSRGQATTQKA